jgi:hypothetical protein
VVQNGVTDKRTIVVGQRSGGGTEVKKGLTIEERILVGEPGKEKK